MKKYERFEGLILGTGPHFLGGGQVRQVWLDSSAPMVLGCLTPKNRM